MQTTDNSGQSLEAMHERLKALSDEKRALMAKLRALNAEIRPLARAYNVALVERLAKASPFCSNASGSQREADVGDISRPREG